MNAERNKNTIAITSGFLGLSSLIYYWCLLSSQIRLPRGCGSRYRYSTKICKKPRLYVDGGHLKEMLLKGVPNLFTPYRPSPWLINSHLMTIAGGKSHKPNLQKKVESDSFAPTGRRLL